MNTPSMGSGEYVTFPLGKGWYAFPILDIAFPITPIASCIGNKNSLHIQPLPLQDENLLGLSNVHGEICVILSIENILGVKHQRGDDGLFEGLFFRHSNSYSYCILLDTVPNIISIPFDDMESVPSSLGDVDGNFFSAVYQQPNGKFFGVLNPETIIDKVKNGDLDEKISSY